jgi:carbonic anhydrase/acetyltransferase-like protein (isoleucine patch superfamily)
MSGEDRGENSGFYAADGSRIVGDVTLGSGCSVWYNAVIRGDENKVTVGENTNIQDNAVIHAGPVAPVNIGSGVTVGHGAIVHGCTVGDNSLIGMGSIVMNNAVIGQNCIIGAGSLVTEGMNIPDGSVAFGSPARVHHATTADEAEGNRRNAAMYSEMGKKNRGIS